jgi:hypothetical protein
MGRYASGSKQAVCKTVPLWFVGSNPTRPTMTYKDSYGIVWRRPTKIAKYSDWANGQLLRHMAQTCYNVMTPETESSGDPNTNRESENHGRKLH